jgi:hypothetical protein
MSSGFPYHSPHQLPQPPDIDRAAEMREARWQALKSRLNWAVIAEEFLGQLNARLACPHHPVAEVFRDLQDSPLEDAFELDGWLHYTPPREKARLGEAVLRLIAEAQLHILAQLDDRPF